ncbi:hypothetical protein ACFSM5_21190 [Lacibacterium aquatile]|uniref:Uncharacterized protein n=1 Tax=Lacibacterium aquatile TaxID=1168082 RepID=A0ABW5E1E9_9PROT
MKLNDLPDRAHVSAHFAVRAGAFVTMLELESIHGALRLKRIVSRRYSGVVHSIEPQENLVVAEALGGSGAIVLHESTPDADRARHDRRELMRRSHPGAGQVETLIAAGQRIALRSREPKIASWPRAQKLGLGAALGLAFLTLDYLYSRGRLTAEGLRASMMSVEELLDVEPVRRRARQAA